MAAILGLTENQRAIASNLDGYFNSGRTLPTSFSALYAASGNTLANGISTLSGETTTGAEQTAFFAHGEQQRQGGVRQLAF